jgi:signal transduction histidine kinase
LISSTDSLGEETLFNTLNRISTGLSGLTLFFSEDGTLIFSDMDLRNAFILPQGVSAHSRVVQIQTMGNESYITVSGKIIQSGVTLYLLIATDISGIIVHNEQMMQSFLQVYFITLVISMIGILILSMLVTGPIKKMNKTAAQISQGKYNERLPISSGDEIGELSDNYNLMADAVESKIHELLINAQQKEDFVANFAHELKTPLTSVIGYADMLYQKTLSAEQIKSAAWYILNEGLRLEALSLKLMDLIILNRTDFTLEEMRSDELLSDIAGGLKPMLEEKKVNLGLNVCPADIKVEYDLFKTLLLNLIDNAIKAGSSKIEIIGKQEDDFYTHDYY